MSREEKMYGMTQNEVAVRADRAVENWYFGDIVMLLMSSLSDAQEEIDRGLLEEARQNLNRVKFLLHHYKGKGLILNAPVSEPET